MVDFMTELSFLLDLLLNDKLTKATKDKLTERIKYVEASSNQQQRPVAKSWKAVPASLEPPLSLDTIAHTPEVAAAMANRQAVVNAAINQKPMVIEKNGSTGPRKF
jgi:hypothetical protein